MSTKKFIARFGVDNNNQTLANVANPVNLTDAVNKSVTDSILSLTQSAYDKANAAFDAAGADLTALTANVSYLQGVDATQNTRITTVEANTVYLFGALNETNTNIGLANTQLKAYTDGLVSSSVSSANTQLKSYTDGQISYVSGVNNTQNNSIQSAWNTANNALPLTGGVVSGDITANNLTANLAVYTPILYSPGGTFSIEMSDIGIIAINPSGGSGAGPKFIGKTIEVNSVYSGSYGGNFLSLNNETKLGSNRYDTVQIVTGIDGSINNTWSFANSHLIFPDNTWQNTAFTDAYVTQINSNKANTIYTQGVDETQNTRITTVEANTVYLFGALNATNTSITSANTQLKSYTDGLVSSSVSSANTQLKSYTDGAISSVVSSANTQLKSYTDGVIASSNTQVVSYIDGKISYVNNINNTQNTNITTATNLAQGAYDTANLKFNSSGGNITGPVTISSNLTITGNLTVSGNVTTVSANNLVLKDNMIYLNDGNTVANPDLGFAGNYNDGTYHHAGFFRDASDGYWKVFDNYKPEPDASPYIDTSNATFRIADFQANNVTFGKITTSSSVLVTNLNSQYLNGQTGSYYAVASEQNGVNATQNTNITNTQTWLDANISYISGVNIAQNSSIVNANTQLKAYTDGLVSSSVSSANTQLKSYTDGAISSAVSSANTQLKSYTDGAISSSVSSANTQLKAYTDGQISYISGVDDSQNTRITTVEANTVYLFGALNQTNTNIGLANTQLKAYADGIVSSANTQLKAYTDGAIASSNTQLKTYVDGQVSTTLSYVSGVDTVQNTRITTVEANTIYLFGALNQTNANIGLANTQLKAYTDGQISYGSGVNTSQNTSISALQTLANTDYTTISVTAGDYGSATIVPVIKLAANGRISAISNTNIVAGATITDDTTTNASRYVMLGQATSGSYTVANTSSTKLTFNPSTGALSATSFVGAAAAGTLSGTTLASGVTASSLTSVGTITSGTWSGSFGAVSGANLTGLTAGNLSGTIPSGVLGNSTHYVGTTAIALNRASASQTLTGVSIDGNADTSGYILNTNIGRTGSQGFISTTGWGTADWANQPISGLGMTIASTPGAPNSNYGFFNKFGNRDAGGPGWGGMWMDYDGSNIYYGATVLSTSYATWKRLLDSGNYTSYAMPAGASATNSVDVRAPIFYDSNDTGYYVNPNSISQFSRVNANDYIYSSNQMYSTITYDTNDTGYYCDPNSTTRVNLLRTTNWLYIDNNYGHSIVGVYASTIFQGVFAMGDSWKLTAAGGINNLYGMCWSHPNAGGIAANLDSHGMIVAINGGFGSCMSYSIKASGNVTAYSDERLKKNWGPMPENFVSRLAKVKVGTYDRMDGERLRQVGVSAQSLRPLLPEAVIEANDDIKTLSVSYGNAAMASAVELAKEIIQLKDQINLLTERLNKMGC